VKTATRRAFLRHTPPHTDGIGKKSYDYANFCRTYAKKALQHIVY